MNLVEKEKIQVQREQLTSAIERAAAQWGWDSGVGLRCLGLHYDLVALHETLADELFKHLLGRHLHTLLVPPEKTDGCSHGHAWSRAK